MTALRPVSAADIETLEAQDIAPPGHEDVAWWGYASGPSVRQRFAAGTCIRPDGGLLVVVDDDDCAVGDVSWHQVSHGPPPASCCWNIGIWLHPDARGKGHGAAAQRLLAEYLFATTTYHRVEADTDVDNIAEQRALERAGFTREGVMRGAMFRAGAFHDSVLYGIVRGDL